MFPLNPPDNLNKEFSVRSSEEGDHVGQPSSADMTQVMMSMTNLQEEDMATSPPDSPPESPQNFPTTTTTTTTTKSPAPPTNSSESGSNVEISANLQLSPTSMDNPSSMDGVMMDERLLTDPITLVPEDEEAAARAVLDDQENDTDHNPPVQKDDKEASASSSSPSTATSPAPPESQRNMGRSLDGNSRPILPALRIPSKRNPTLRYLSAPLSDGRVSVDIFVLSSFSVCQSLHFSLLARHFFSVLERHSFSSCERKNTE
jgi:hypothetical protein